MITRSQLPRSETPCGMSRLAGPCALLQAQNHFLRPDWFDAVGILHRRSSQWIAWARAPGHDSYWRFHRDDFLRLVPPPGRLTLEIGCGEGRVLRDLVRTGHKAVGVDLSTVLAHAATTHPEAAGEVVVADAVSSAPISRRRCRLCGRVHEPPRHRRTGASGDGGSPGSDPPGFVRLCNYPPTQYCGDVRASPNGAVLPLRYPMILVRVPCPLFGKLIATDIQ